MAVRTTAKHILLDTLVIPVTSQKVWKVTSYVDKPLKVALQILGRQFYKNTKKSSLYSESLIILIHKAPIAENHSTTREIRDLLQARSTPTGNPFYFYMSNSLIYIPEMYRRSFKHSIRRRHYGKWLHACYVMEFKRHKSLANHLTFPQCFFFILAGNRKLLRGYVAL